MSGERGATDGMGVEPPVIPTPVKDRRFAIREGRTSRERKSKRSGDPVGASGREWVAIHARSLAVAARKAAIGEYYLESVLPVLRVSINHQERAFQSRLRLPATSRNCEAVALQSVSPRSRYTSGSGSRPRHTTEAPIPTYVGIGDLDLGEAKHSRPDVRRDGRDVRLSAHVEVARDTGRQNATASTIVTESCPPPLGWVRLIFWHRQAVANATVARIRGR